MRGSNKCLSKTRITVPCLVRLGVTLYMPHSAISTKIQGRWLMVRCKDRNSDYNVTVFLLEGFRYLTLSGRPFLCRLFHFFLPDIYFKRPGHAECETSRGSCLDLLGLAWNLTLKGVEMPYRVWFSNYAMWGKCLGKACRQTGSSLRGGKCQSQKPDPSWRRLRKKSSRRAPV